MTASQVVLKFGADGVVLAADLKVNDLPRFQHWHLHLSFALHLLALAHGTIHVTRQAVP